MNPSLGLDEYFVTKCYKLLIPAHYTLISCPRPLRAGRPQDSRRDGGATIKV